MKLPQLCLRELFLLVALAAMGCGWWVDREYQAKQLMVHHESVCSLLNPQLKQYGITLAVGSKGRLYLIRDP
jgi:hypothetical protein